MSSKFTFFFIAGLFLLLLFRADSGPKQLGGGNVRGRLNIYRDAQGVAHIVANNRYDLMYGMGYVQAQDRLWTLHFKKRFLEGRVS